MGTKRRTSQASDMIPRNLPTELQDPISKMEGNFSCHNRKVVREEITKAMSAMEGRIPCNVLLFFQSPCACAAERLKRRPKPWIKKTFGGSSQNRYTFSICATLPSISSVNLVHFRFVVHFTDLCKSKNDGPDRQRKHHNCKKGPETPKKTLTKNINSMYRPIGEQTLESTEGGTT